MFIVVVKVDMATRLLHYFDTYGDDRQDDLLADFETVPQQPAT